MKTPTVRGGAYSFIKKENYYYIFSLYHLDKKKLFQSKCSKNIRKGFPCCKDFIDYSIV